MRLRPCLISGLVISLALGLAACGPVPMAVIASNGHTFHGTLTAGIPTTFQVSDGHLTCTGKFPTIVPGPATPGAAVPYTLPMLCNRGVTGIANFNNATSLEGGGNLRLSDGTEGSFIYGSGAAAL